MFEFSFKLYRRRGWLTQQRRLRRRRRRRRRLLPVSRLPSATRRTRSWPVRYCLVPKARSSALSARTYGMHSSVVAARIRSTFCRMAYVMSYPALTAGVSACYRSSSEFGDGPAEPFTERCAQVEPSRPSARQQHPKMETKMPARPTLRRSVNPHRQSFRCWDRRVARATRLG